jgi:hypothetical protein
VLILNALGVLQLIAGTSARAGPGPMFLQGIHTVRVNLGGEPMPSELGGDPGQGNRHLIRYFVR